MTKESLYCGDGYNITFTLQDSWSSGFDAIIKIENTGSKPIEDWSLALDYQGDITSVWDAVIDSKENDNCIIRNAVWNQDVPVGQSVMFGIRGNASFVAFPSDCKLVGEKSNVNIKGCSWIG